MPITIEPPAPWSVLGVGSVLNFSTSLGPIPTSYLWQVQAFVPTTDEIPYYSLVKPSQGSLGSAIVGEAPSSTDLSGTWQYQRQIADGDPVSVRVDLLDGANGNAIVDEGQISIPWQTNANLPSMIKLNSQASAGSSPDNSAQIQDIWDWTHVALQTALGAALTTPIGSILAHPDPNFLALSPEVFVLSGRGTRAPAATAGFAGVYGIVWQVSTWPPGAGLLDGVVEEWDLRVAQFALEYTERVSGRGYIGELHDLSADNGLFMWARYLPHVFHFDVTPGFALTCQWFGAY